MLLIINFQNRDPQAERSDRAGRAYIRARKETKVRKIPLNFANISQNFIAQNSVHTLVCDDAVSQSKLPPYEYVLF
jgi:hypothetical protein